MPTGVLTFLLTDVENSTHMWERHPDAMHEADVRHDAIVRGCAERHGGVVPLEQGEGDSAVIVFARATDAVACALDLQRAFATERWPSGIRLAVRTAVHTGEAELRDGVYRGVALSRCARLRALARGGQVVLSDVTASLVRDRLPDGGSLVDLGSFALKGLSRPERVWQLSHPDLACDAPPRTGARASQPPAAAHPLIGRQAELAAIKAFLDATSRALLLDGDAGIGKTVLWQAGIDAARESFGSVLVCRGVEAEASLSFAALSDLLSGVVDDALPALVPPRRHALEVALLLAEPDREPPDPRAVGFAVLDVLRALAASGPALVAADDVQWIDAASAQALGFALRRLGREPVGALATRRIGTGMPPGLDGVFPLESVLTLGPVTVGELYQLLRDRLGVRPPRPELVRVHAAAGGNPFFALEIARELERTGARAELGKPLPVPGALADLVGRRLAALPPATRDVLLAAAALTRPTLELLSAVSDGDVVAALDPALRDGIVAVPGSRVEFTHPLLASVCYERSPAPARRAAHVQLAAAVTDIEERARHLALAAEGPDEAVAAELEAASEHAAGRGATAAAELAELAARLTPDGDPRARARRLRAAHLHRIAGDPDRARAILEGLLAEAAAGAERADVLFALASTRKGDLPAIIRVCEDALAEIPQDDGRAARILAFRSWMRLEADLPGALADARAALEKADAAGDPALIATAIARTAIAELLAADITPGLLERGLAIEDTLTHPLEFHESPRAAHARYLTRTGDLDGSRKILEAAAAAAAARGDEGTRGHILWLLVAAEWMAGRLPRAAELAAAALELSEQTGDRQYRASVLGMSALVHAHRGAADDARAAAEEALAIADQVHDETFAIWGTGVLGHLELVSGDAHAAWDKLERLPARQAALGWIDPMVPFWTDVFEAAAAVGEVDRLRGELARYADLVGRLNRPWASEIAGRAHGLLAAAEGDLAAAASILEDTIAARPDLAYPLDRARTWLALGSVRRRAAQKRAAREATERALAMFDELGARLWAERAREELSRVSGRRASGELTDAEERVASLAARGASNKEIAAKLYVSVHTVEAHLSRVYRKLGVRSRAQLAAKL